LLSPPRKTPLLPVRRHHQQFQPKVRFYFLCVREMDSCSPLAKGNSKSAPDCPPMSSGCVLPTIDLHMTQCLTLAAKHLSSHPLTTGGVVTQKRQSVPLAQDVLTAKLSPTQCKLCFLYLVISSSRCFQCLPKFRFPRAKIPAPSNVSKLY